MKPRYASVILCLCSFSCGASAAQELAPKPRDTEEHWVKRHAEYVAEAKKAAYDVLFLGDSITFCWRWEGQGKEPFQKRFPDLVATTRFFGVPGDGVQHLRWRIQNGEFAGQTPKVVCLLIGTNDLGIDPALIVDGVKKNIEEVLARSPTTRIILHGIFPRGEKPSPERDVIKGINRQIAAFADDKRVFFIDFGDKFLQPDGTISPEMMGDFLHLAPKGYELWASELEKPLRALLK